MNAIYRARFASKDEAERMAKDSPITPDSPSGSPNRGGKGKMSPRGTSDNPVAGLLSPRAGGEYGGWDTGPDRPAVHI